MPYSPSPSSGLRSAFSRRGIGRRLLLLIILFSSCVTLLSTGVQLYVDYQRDLSAINTRLDEVESGYLGSISASLWNLDIRQLQLQLEGVRHLPDIQSVAVYENPQGVDNPLALRIGEPVEQRAIVREYRLVYHLGGEGRDIGRLVINASMDEVYRRLWEKAVVILMTQGVKTFVVSLFILYIFYRLVTQHLSTIAQFVSRFKLGKATSQLTLARTPPRKADELDQVTHAFNELGDNLHQAYEALREVNAELERDIIARRRAEEEVKRLNEGLEQRVRQRTAELEAANKELASFSYSVSHDLRAPLRRIEGFRRILVEDCGHDLHGDAGHYLSRIESGTREMAEMIDSFLRLSRVTQGELCVEDTNVSQLVQRVFNQQQEREPDRPARLELEPDICADVDRRIFEVLITNLLDNAWKYSRQRNEILIRFARDQSSGQNVYCLGDNGVGFDMKYADRLFTPFSRLHKAEDFDGIGIGLATVQRIIARHGGRIWAKSSPGAGATFYFTLWERNTECEQGYYSVG
ncbi:sensor histidine kinase [Marinimicrobium alkaliphilum]|uniref:sensor histidine kinase n=1 Tax=Marinimicrobium alkaliphilum TaxID=2202654 RepID=UPI000DBA0EA0|nr:ATP-binding protein [Marinimicrobium alkaliphilum]